MNPRIPHAFETDDEYRAAPGENWSRLKHLRTSPKVYRYRIDNPEVDTSSRGMLRATHCLALEPSVFARDFHVKTAHGATLAAILPKVADPETGDPVAAIIRRSLGLPARPVLPAVGRKGSAEYKDWLAGVPGDAITATPNIIDKAFDSVAKLIEDVRAIYEGKTLIGANDHATASAIADAVATDPSVRAMLDTPGVEVYYELPIVWTDPVFGVPCKAKLDILIVDWDAGTATVVDLKTVRRIDPRGMARDAEQMGYHGQIAGHYARAATAVTGFHEDAIGCAILAVEGKAPHDVGIFYFSPADVWQGRRLRDSLMTRRAECIAADSWPGKVPTPVNLDLPCYDAGLDDEPEITIGG